MKWWQRTNRDKIVFLEVTSYVGISLGAEHSYGTLKGSIGSQRKAVEVERSMTRGEAKKRNIADGRRGLSGLNKEGELTSRLKDREDVASAGLAMWAEHFPWAQVLVIGSTAIIEPKRILAGPGDMMPLNLLWADWYEFERDTSEIDGSFSTEWEQAMSKYISTLSPVSQEAIAADEDAEIVTIIEERRKAEAERKEAELEARAQADLRRAENLQESLAWHDEHPYQRLELTIVGRSMWDEEQSKGRATFWISAADVYEGDNDDHVGAIMAGTSGEWWIRHKEYAPHGIRFQLRDIWQAFLDAVENGKLTECRLRKEA